MVAHDQSDAEDLRVRLCMALGAWQSERPRSVAVRWFHGGSEARRTLLCQEPLFEFQNQQPQKWLCNGCGCAGRRAPAPFAPIALAPRLGLLAGAPTMGVA